MRPLKFRLIKDNKIVGWERHEEEHGLLHINHYPTGSPAGVSFPVDGDYGRYIPHDRKDQFTGRHDSTGAEIYENDETDQGKIEYRNSLVWDGGGSSHPGFYPSNGYDYDDYDRGNTCFQKGFGHYDYENNKEDFGNVTITITKKPEASDA